MRLTLCCGASRLSSIVALAVALVLCIGTTAAQTAGFRFIDIPADAEGPAIHGAMWTPCAEPAAEIDLGNVTMPGVKDCPIVGDKLPLVVISHGAGGNFVNFHDMAETLADAGFIVAAIDHPGNTSSDMSRIGDISSLIERPEDIKRLIDFMLDASPAAASIDSARIGFFGFSRGGYTGLMLAGGIPDWAAADRFCKESSLRACEQLRDRQAVDQQLAYQDARIRALVVADPGFRIGTLVFSFVPDSLAAIKVPVQLWASQYAGDGLFPEHVAAVDKSLPTRHEHRLVASAGHFAFTLCLPGLAERRPELCIDAPGFDRVAFHKQLDADVLAFFQTQLTGL
jgi:predicted dienelactone hydrolase